MERLISGILAIGLLMGVSGCADSNIEKGLKICALYGDQGMAGATYPVTIRDLIEQGGNEVEIKDKGNSRIIITHLDARGTKIFDVIAQKININNSPSCYAMEQIYIYQNGTYLPKQTWGSLIGRVYGPPEEKLFKIEDVKQ